MKLTDAEKCANLGTIKIKNKTFINGPIIDLPTLRPEINNCLRVTAGFSCFNSKRVAIISLDSSITAPKDPNNVSAKKSGRGTCVTYSIDS